MQRAIPVFDFSQQANVSRMPAWIRQKLANPIHYAQTARAVHGNTLHTVCEEAACPNMSECWSHGTATLMLLGDTCVRACGFCAVKTGKPSWHDSQEAQRVAEAVQAMGLDYVVLTSVNRDDLDDGGAGVFADTVVALRRNKPDIGIELLTPDFYRQQQPAIDTICTALESVRSEQRDTQLVWGHNVETVPRLYKQVRRGSDYARSLKLLELAVEQKDIEAKSALMLGLGETREEVLAVLKDLREIGVQRLSLGQYLRPTKFHLPVKEYVSPQAFDSYAQEAKALGFSWVKAGPLVRSSYHAHDE
jgi:lipoic acid synthetase